MQLIRECWSIFSWTTSY